MSLHLAKVSTGVPAEAVRYHMFCFHMFFSWPMKDLWEGLCSPHREENRERLTTADVQGTFSLLVPSLVAAFLLPGQVEGGIVPVWWVSLLYHYTQHEYRTELYYFRIIVGNSCYVIARPYCFWN